MIALMTCSPWNRPFSMKILPLCCPATTAPAT